METIYSFGYWLRRRRKALDLTQRQLADLAGCALITLKKIEADERRPSVQMAESLAEALQIPAAERLAFIDAARGRQPVDTLAPPPQLALYRSRDAIPRPSTPLVGREEELQTLLLLLDQPETRLVTVVGPGGMGKTRLVMAAGRTLSEQEPHPYPQGILFVDLAAASTVTEMANMVAVTLGFEPDVRLRDETGLAGQLAGYLQPRRCLLILDNVEQIDGAASVINEWVRHTTAPHFLITSRERLNLAGEHLLALPGLQCPTSAAPDPNTYPAGRLFMARARRIRSGFVVRDSEWHSLADVCRLVDGMPLALELAASWVDTLTTGEIAMELQRDLGLLNSNLVDLPSRHRSFDTIWSSTWARLEPEAQATFAQLSIFRGGFTRAAAEAVAGASLSNLAQLTGRYLMSLDRDNGRYRIHELLRQYGLEHLGVSSAAVAVRQRHFEYYEHLLADELANLRGPAQLTTLERLDCEQDNIRLALRWGLQSFDCADRLAQMIYNLNWYWRIRSRVREGQEWLAQALVQTGRSPVAEATILFVAGHLAWMASDFDAARQHQQTSLALLEDGTAPATAFRAQLAAYVMMSLGMIEFHRGHAHEALQWKLRSLERFRALEDEWGTAFIMGQLGRVLQETGDPAAATEAMTEALARGQALGDPFLLAIFNSNAAFMALADGDLDRASEMARNAGGYQRETGHMHSMGQLLIMLGRLAWQRGDEAAAEAHWQEALAVSLDMGNTQFAAEASRLLAQLPPNPD